jgi:nucleoside-diphosphate-sugar epimerase
MASQPRILVAGAGGFVGHHLAKTLKARGAWVRGVDIRKPLYEDSPADEFELLDLRRWENCLKATAQVDEVYHLAADTGGIGYVRGSAARIATANILITTHLLDASRENRVKRFAYASSINVLAHDSATSSGPTLAYGREKLYGEDLCRYFREDTGIATRVARFHNVYGPLDIYRDPRERAINAMLRKILESPAHEAEIEIWGDGEQSRSFIHVRDCVEGLIELVASDRTEPTPLGTSEVVTINELVDLMTKVTDQKISKRYLPQQHEGARSRPESIQGLLSSSDGFQWHARIRLEDGLRETTAWLRDRLMPTASGAS